MIITILLALLLAVLTDFVCHLVGLPDPIPVIAAIIVAVAVIAGPANH